MRLAVLAVGLLVALLLRIVLWPLPGLAGDLDDFARWAGSISRDGLGAAYSNNPISFPPVLPWLWAGLGSFVPALAHADAAGDIQVRAALKLPASLADLALAAGVGYALRPRRWWALAAVLVVALQPIAIYLSAWWGQFESLYVLPILVAYVLAVRGRLGWAGVALAVALMTKPQALPLAVPFAAWVVGRAGWRGALSPAIAGGATIAFLWAPFVASGGPLHYLENLRSYSELFSVISLRAWNPWWLFQIPFGTDQLIVDTIPLVGPITLRVVGLAIAVLVGVAIAAWVARRPTPESLAWGLVAMSLAAFCALTIMHERYAYAAVALLPLLWPDRRAIVLWAVVSVVFSLNVLASVPPSGGPGSLIPVGGLVGAVGAVTMTACLGAALLGLRTASGSGGAALALEAAS